MKQNEQGGDTMAFHEGTQREGKSLGKRQHLNL